MALQQIFTVLVIALVAFSRVEITLSLQVTGSVICNDCDPHFNFTGIAVAVKCKQVKHRSQPITGKNGDSATVTPSNATASPPTNATIPPNCVAYIVSISRGLNAARQNMTSKISLVQGANNTTYGILRSPLVFSKSCHGKCESPRGKNIDSSKFTFTMGFHLPKITIQPKITITATIPSISIDGVPIPIPGVE